MAGYSGLLGTYLLIGQMMVHAGLPPRMLVQERHRQELSEYGFTVVRDVLTEDECQLHIQEYIDWIERNFPDGVFPHSNRSLIQRYKIGHLAPSWKVRLKAKPVFAELWGTDELLTSVDSVSIGRPPEQGQEEFHSLDKSWLHLDQSPGRVGLHAYQGGLYLETANLDDWVFECMDRSHKQFARFWEDHPQEREEYSQGREFLRLEDKHIKWFREKGCLRKRVAVPKGGLLLWDSRLVHNNVRPIQGRINSERWRFVVLVCMTPASWADAASLRLKKRAYREMRMTTHWPSTGVRLFPDTLPDGAPTAKHPLKALPKVATTLEAMQLAGVTSYNKLLKKSEKEEKDASKERNIPAPEFSPDYKPPKPDNPSDYGWIVVAVVSSLVCAVSVYLYVHMFNQAG